MTIKFKTRSFFRRPSSETPGLDHRDNRWKPPLDPALKLNVDAHLLGDGRWGLRFVFRRSCGRPAVVATRTITAPDDPCVAEALAVKLALDWIQEAGWRNVVIESDAKALVDKIRISRFPRGYWGLIGQNCLEILSQLPDVSICWVRRTGNWVAHATACNTLSLLKR